MQWARNVAKKNSYVKSIPYIRVGVSDMKKSAPFYEQVLGLDKLTEWSTGAIFDIAGVALGIEYKAKPDICLLVDDVDETYKNLKDKGVKFLTEPQDQPWGGRDASLVDPDGNILVIESFKCKICGKACQTYRELLEEHMRKHK
jgi:predicted enzyme related to lactoylglutathione lyase